MIIDGEKWACEACVRGHRVSNCQHSDRPLQHINKKGRPVSQCQHCRTMRKSRASHVKCDCGEKSHKCAHLKTTVEGHRDSCCCNHGGRCTCSHKKEPQLDPVPESDSDEHDTTVSASAGCGSKSTTSSKATITKAGAVRVRRRANTIQSDGSALTFDENGRHKPTYKHAKASSKCEPYPLKRVNSVHSTSSLPNRSPVDSPAAGGCCGDSSAGHESSAAAAARRAVRSETASPLLAGGAANFSQLNGQLPPLDLSGIEYPRYVPGSGSAGFDLFGTGLPDHEAPMFSAGLSAPPVDWSHYDGLDFGRGGDAYTPSSFGHAQSYGGTGGGAFDYSGSEQAPTMTTATSGNVSEVEDLMGPGADDFDVSGAFSAAAGGYGSLLGSSGASGADLSALEYEDFGGLTKAQGTGSATKLYATTTAGDSTLAAPAGAAFADDPLFWINDYSHSLPVMDNATADPNALYWESR